MGFLDALGGGIAAAADTQTAISMDQIKAQIEQDRQNAIASFNAELNLENQPKLEAARLRVQSEAAENARQAQVGRIKEAKQGLINQNMESQFGASDQAVAAAANGETIGDLTDEQNSAIAQSKKLAVDSMSDNATIRASVAAGYSDPIELVKMNKADAANAIQAQLAAIKERDSLTREQHAQDWSEAQAARTDAILAKIGAKEGAKDNVPAEVQATQWYMDNQDNPKAMAAWDRVHEGKSKNIISLAADFLSKDPNAGEKNAMTADRAYQLAEQLYTKAGARDGATKATGALPEAPKVDTLFPPKSK